MDLIVGNFVLRELVLEAVLFEFWSASKISVDSNRSEERRVGKEC